MINSLNKARINSIQAFWLGEQSNLNASPAQEYVKKWFFGGAEVDDAIKTNFHEDLMNLASGAYEDWKTDPQGKMAAVILADQFPRNMFRKHKDAFAYDHIALDIVKSISDEDFDKYAIQEQAFLYLPYEHSENVEDQAKAVYLALRSLERAKKTEP